ncbi:MAG TPA: hypothetical protein VFQ12_11765 [Thermoleophilaceae bacterium]|nr:hypothetical protein [Thermoleophilaceae bacterium]
MTTTDKLEPRRYKMPSELTADEEASTRAFGSKGRIEREEYRRWRQDVLAGERDDLPLRMRLLEEEAEVLRTRAGGRRTAALEAMSVEDHMARIGAQNDGQEPEPLDDDGATGFEADAAELEAQAQEIAQHLAETQEAV